MKRITWIVACAATLALALFALSGCGSKAENASVAVGPTEGMDFIVGFDQEYPPYGFVGDDGQYTGFDLELAKEVCARNGWNFKAQPVNWDAKDAELNGGAVTCLWNGFTKEGREKNYTFSEPYMLNGQVVVVKADKASEYGTLDALAGKTVVTQVDSSALEVLQGAKADLNASFAGGAVNQVSDYNAAFMDLQSGACDAVACDLSIAEYQMSANPGAYAVLKDTLSDEHYAVGFAKGNTELADAVTETLREMNADGTVKALCDKYAEYGISYENWTLK
ncbi:transporter substrate-binding domain-containing protein [Slackia exigua]|nr:transporter substrate-binding domain-containing protein [Slackia exigua]MDK7723231.1 transporter substrate-binding domain-containing protein [Slackia exigua]MDK7725424.1 transporter substrate-binding domain-containing protein [Slackia exigua]STN99110.1 Sulfate starvation-induced protein 7 [Slackia exigua]